MASKLNRIRNWEELGRKSDFSATRLASHCGISVRQLERFFKKQFNVSPHRWLRSLRMQMASELLAGEASVKETAYELGYKASEHFSRDFKLHSGSSPSRHATVIVG